MHTFKELKRNLKKDFSGRKIIKLAVLSDSASQLLVEAIRGYGYEVNINFDIFEADYDQIELQVFDHSSELYAFAPEFIFINNSTEKLLKNFHCSELHKQVQFAENAARQTERYYEAIAGKLKAKVIFNTFPEINDSTFGNFASKTTASFIFQLRKLNVELMEFSQRSKDVFICDLASAQSELGYRFVFDPKFYVSADMVYSIDFLPYVAKHMTDIVLSIAGNFKKCLILDLDNTLWGGIIGDDGIEGIQVGHLGIGKVFTDFQLWIRQLKRRGIIIAVCSKNEEATAKAPFLEHPDIVLGLDDFAVFVANWENKVDNIRYIQSILNIGYESMVFVDDNPFEREMVRLAIPEIAVPEMPEDPAEYMLYLRSLNLFETASFTEEDTQRTRQYQEEASRAIYSHSFKDENEFLKSLDMKVEVKQFDKFSIPRVAQLSQRSNQFNLRTVRYTEEVLARLSTDPEYYGFSLSLKDRFGDHGLIAIIILKKEGEALFIDSWIMSCRVLKKGMENFTFNTILEYAVKQGFKEVVGEYIATKKNIIVKDHYANLGFEPRNGKWFFDTRRYTPRLTFINTE